MNAATTPRTMNALLEAMRAQSLGPLWELYEQIVKRQPEGIEPAAHWSWASLEALIESAMQSVTGDLADHRVLLLMHPQFAGRIATTRNLLAGVQCVLPGERTVAHRHTAGAVRFVLESEGAQTFVDGKACPMYAGDVILTPNWTWHAHENQTAKRAVWIDMLDAPLTALLAATFGARGAPETFPVTLATFPDEAFARGGLTPACSQPETPYSPRVRWTREDILSALGDAPPARDGSRRVRFTNPVSGGAVTSTLDIEALALPTAAPTQRIRSSASMLCVVMSGEGESQIGEITHRWSERDVFTVPQWTAHAHRAHRADAQLLLVSDREAYRRLGLLREESL